MEPSPARRALHQSIGSYIREFDKQSSQLQQLITRVDRQRAEQARQQTEAGNMRVFSQVTSLAVGLTALGAAPFTRGISLVGLPAAAGGYYYFQLNANPAKCEEIERRFRRTAAKIQGIVDSLRTKLDTVIAAVRDLIAEYDGVNQENLNDLQDRLRASAVNTFRGDVELPEAKEHFSGIMEELRDVKSLLQQLPIQP